MQAPLFRVIRAALALCGKPDKEIARDASMPLPELRALLRGDRAPDEQSAQRVLHACGISSSFLTRPSTRLRIDRVLLGLLLQHQESEIHDAQEASICIDKLSITFNVMNEE